ncbi:MAG: GTPase [Piscirickettsiaceae bacterium]|nr:MAG: GTPase [Piscirickettsiaceae bacterium]
MVRQFDNELRSYDLWKQQAASSIHAYQEWLDDAGLSDTDIEMELIKNLRLLDKNNITIAFAAEFSRGKTELINALFFSSTGVRLLPSSPGRTTMCPTELFYDANEAPYLRLLDIKTRLSDKPIESFKKDPKKWTHVELDCDSPEQMQEAFQALLKTKLVDADIAEKLGLPGKPGETEVEVPCWRHAMISFPHPLLERGLTVLDTPGLNALGSEPELTLSMLPSAQAMFFVLAADTGVTQSDMDMWNHHIRAYKSKHPNGLAVVLNKIDTLQDDLMSDDEVSALIHKQTRETAKLLDLDEQSIFPLSAKQALVGKIKKDKKMIEDSRLSSLENFLSERVMSSQRDIMQSSVIDGTLDRIGGSRSLIENRIHNASTQYDELASIHNKSEEVTAELIFKSRLEQTAYNKNLTHLKTSRHLFNTQVAELLHQINPARVKSIVEEGSAKMISSWTSVGIRDGMKRTFDGLNTLLNETITQTYSSVKLLDAIYKRFKDEHAFKSEQGTVFKIDNYQQELEQLLEEGIEFSHSSMAALTEQNTLAKRFVNTVGRKATTIFEDAYLDVKKWQTAALAPLIAEVNEQKASMEGRLDNLRSVAEGKDALEDKMSEAKELETLAKEQLKVLLDIVESLEVPAADELETPAAKEAAS